VSAEQDAALNALAAALAGFRAEVAAAPDSLPQVLDWMRALASTVEDLLAVLGEDEAAADTRRVGAIRELLARFDWAAGDPRRALEAIGRIVEGGQP
jgi:hypothetical protein